ncbi:hypothetical protein PENTCL1PPCAC_10790, partial [Pristionchus entomophagus]
VSLPPVSPCTDQESGAMRSPTSAALLLLAAATVSLAAQQPTVPHSSLQHQPQPQSQQPIEADSCPPNTFTCRDGSCIPLDWVGDGEPDCDDHSDEDPHLPMPHPNSAEGTTPIAGSVAPMNTTAAEAELSTESMEDCPSTHLERIDACSQPTFDLLSTLQSFDFNASSILPQSVSTLSVGCDITREYDICVQGASPKCQPEPSIPAWRTAETFFCQLLLPSIHEHAKCFGRERSNRCLININRATSTMCRLVGSIMTDMECLEKTQKGCSEDALAMLAPMREEALQTAKDLNCQIPQLTVISESEGNLLEAEKRKEEEKNRKPEIEFDEDGEPIINEDQSNSTSVQENTTGAEEFDEEEEEEEETTVAKETPATTTRATVPPTVPASQSTTTQQQQTSATKTQQSIAPSTTVTPRSTVPVDAPRPPLGDAIRTMEVISRVCSIPYTGSVWEDVHSLLCSFKEPIQKHTECFAKVSAKARCTPEASVNSSCIAMNAVNDFLDCAIVLMNDDCEVAAQNLVVDLQEKMNDKMIEKRCFDEGAEEEEAKKKEEDDKDGVFRLHPKLPSCSDDQENGALACLVELVQVNKELAQLQQKNFLLEISRPNSTVVDSICGLYSRYDQCLHASVFSLKGGIRCSFSSPLNSLARIGLSPICAPSTRSLLSSHTDCLSRIAFQSSDNQCQSALSSLGHTVQAMIQGAHGEALLCKSFYLIRQTFECGRKQVEASCDDNALMDLTQLKDEMTSLGTEEGCPEVPPPNLDQLIAESFTRAPIVAPKIASRPLPVHPAPGVQLAAPAAAAARANVTGRAPQTVQPVMQSCDQKMQQRFQECVAPLTDYQPHPLIVIRQPRLIDEACQKFASFKECASTVACRPMWSRGMTAMFEYACEEALAEYKEIRGCIRKLAGEDTVRDCVATFSRGAPQQACLSANSLLSCALPSISTTCGEKAVEFTQKYITKFAQAIDPRCKLGGDIPIGKVIGVGCSLEEDAVIEHCAAPLNDIGNRLDEMFQGGLQSLIKNANTLAPVFAGGCNLTAEFQACAAGVLSTPSPCIVSSCMVRAGEEICSSPDPVSAIDANLSCVFSQVQEPSFAKCIRSTLSTIKQFSLNSFKAMLPKFVDCVEEIVKVKCGETPIKILRAISSREVCPMQSAGKRIVPIMPVQVTHAKKPTCDAEMKQKYRDCGKAFYSKYRMLPVSILNSGEHMDEFCSTLETMDTCSISSRLCASHEELALKALGVHLCSAKETFDNHKICLKKTAENAEVASCLSEFLTSTSPSSRCSSLQGASKCMAEQIRNSCGEDSLQYAFTAMNVYASAAYDKCQMSIPTVSLSTECSEADLIEFLTCESHIDSFSPRPIAVIANASALSEFCEAVETQYRPCLEGMKCKFEPVSTANINLYTAICQEQVTRRDHSRMGQCLADYTNTVEGRGCISPLTSLDLLNNEYRAKVCSTVSSVLSCAVSSLEKACGYESVLHLYSLYSDFASHFDSHCAFEVPAESSTPAESSDTVTEVEEQDEPVTTVSTTIAPLPTTTEEQTTTTTTERSHARDFRAKASSSLSMGFSVLLLLVISRFI